MVSRRILPNVVVNVNVLGVRKGIDFYCPYCDWRTNADWNGSRNIQKRDGFLMGTPAFVNAVIESTAPADLISAGNPHGLSVG